MSKKLKNITQKIAKAEAIVAGLKTQQNKERGNNMFHCVGCDGMHKISSCDAWEPLHYNNEAYGEGWDSDHELWASCPKTGLANRFLFSQSYDERSNKQTDVQYRFYWDYSRQFKSLTETNRGSSLVGTNQHQIQWKNNFYIDENRDRFGLPLKAKKCECNQ